MKGYLEGSMGTKLERISLAVLSAIAAAETEHSLPLIDEVQPPTSEQRVDMGDIRHNCCELLLSHTRIKQQLTLFTLQIRCAVLILWLLCLLSLDAGLRMH